MPNADQTPASPALERPGIPVLALRYWLMALALAGCAIPYSARNGARNHVIIGLGWVRTSGQEGVVAQEVRTLGLMIDSSGGSLGMTRKHKVEIDTLRASNAVVSIQSGPQKLIVTNFFVE